MIDSRPLALLFDLDGTLVDSIELILSAFRHTFRTHKGAVPQDEEWIAGIGTPLVTQLRRYATDDDQLQAMAATYRAYQHEHHDLLLREFEGARDTLTLLKARGHPTALVTSKMNDLAYRALEYAGMHTLLDVVVGFDSCTIHKPDPEPVRVALRMLGYEPYQAIFVGDSTHDIVSGNAAGVVTVAALWGPFSRESLERAGPAYLIEHIRDLPALVERMGEGRIGDSGLGIGSQT
jgi:pyrophosphatase PpaX